MKHIHTFESFLNEQQEVLTEAKEKIATYTNDKKEYAYITKNGNKYQVEFGYKDVAVKDKEEAERVLASKGFAINEGTTASGWSKVQLDKELKELADGVRDAGDIDSSMAFDIADSFLMDNPGVEMAIKRYYRADDAQGFVADKLASIL
jgi:hypothetical protein